MSKKPKILVFASGEPEPEKGGSGFENLVNASRDGKTLNAEIVGVVSNHEDGGVRRRAHKLGIPFFHFGKPWSGEGYQRFASIAKADFFALSGWLKLVTGLDMSTNFNPKTVFNIHPGYLPSFGGPGMFGHHVHEAVMDAFRRNEVTHTAISMHFVTEPKSREDYDRGPLFFQKFIMIRGDDTPLTLAGRVNKYEHFYQPIVTEMVVSGGIKWNGIDPSSLRFSPGYTAEKFFESHPFNPE